MNNILPNGLTLLQQNPYLAARLNPEAKDHGWLYKKNHGVWVSFKKLSDDEIETAYDQSANMVVLHGNTGRAG
jgi:hypothetical protein